MFSLGYEALQSELECVKTAWGIPGCPPSPAQMLTPANSEAIVTVYKPQEFPPITCQQHKRTIYSTAEAFEGENFHKFQDFVANWESFLLYSEAVGFCIVYPKV